MKKCRTCGIEKPFSEFHKDNSKLDHLKVNCKECRVKEHKKAGYVTTQRRFLYNNSEEGFIKNKISQIFSKSYIKASECVPDCTKEEIFNHFNEYVNKHGRSCFYCKEPWTYVINRYVPGNGANNKSDKGKSRANKIKNFSIDRLDSSKTYSVDNIIFCCVECNLSKKDISIRTIKRLYEIITERNL